MSAVATSTGEDEGLNLSLQKHGSLGLITMAANTKVTLVIVLIMEASLINAARRMPDHGVDSATATELRRQLHIALGHGVGMMGPLGAYVSIQI